MSYSAYCNSMCRELRDLYYPSGILTDRALEEEARPKCFTCVHRLYRALGGDCNRITDNHVGRDHERRN